MGETASEQTQAAPLASNATIPADAEPFELPSKPDGPSCPACKVGVLYTIAYDEAATHEKDQGAGAASATSHDHFQPSGGSMILRCFLCGVQSSHPLNPPDTETSNARG